MRYVTNYRAKPLTILEAPQFPPDLARNFLGGICNKSTHSRGDEFNSSCGSRNSVQSRMDKAFGLLSKVLEIRVFAPLGRFKVKNSIHKINLEGIRSIGGMNTSKTDTFER